MSWNWNEEKEEAKEYEVKGTVTISTDEYRDLITGLADMKAKGQKEHDDWYREYRKNEDLQKRISELENVIAEQKTKTALIESWLNDDESSRKSFKLWKVEQAEKEESED